MLELIKKISPKYCTKRRAFFATLTVFTTMGIYSLAVGVWLYLKRTDFYELTPTSFSGMFLFSTFWLYSVFVLSVLFFCQLKLILFLHRQNCEVSLLPA
ncbi:hypothetical protein ANCCAN_00240 [Ancylostoma caninum]|uniref:Uncharacterized protein n=1 Tax=Ancylostoma caninum TaxID=29170 RepID=A0A368HB27_ANCCA|nr:hypothetical protein ANCCAN_00240 [Ancylostoma caninum]